MPEVRRLSRGMIGHYTTSLDIGGAQAMLAKLVKHAHACADSLDHAVVSLLSPGIFAPLDEECSIYSVDMVRRPLPTPLALLRLLRITNRISPDLLQGWMYHGNVAASLAATSRPRHTPVIWNVRHSLADPANESRSTRALLKISARLSRQVTAIIYNSRTAARQHEAVGFDGNKAVHIPNGFDCTLYRPDPSRRAVLAKHFAIPEQRICVAMVARCHPMKDHQLLVEATARAIEAGHDLHLLLVGPGFERPPASLRTALAQLAADRITISGGRTDVAEWLPGVDILALSSAWGEAFPNILGEAMACGVPCIATDVGDSGWIMGPSGIVVPPRDPSAFAAAIMQLSSESKDERRRRGMAARARIQDAFELEHISRQYRRLYLSILRGKESVSDLSPMQPANVRVAAQ